MRRLLSIALSLIVVVACSSSAKDGGANDHEADSGAPHAVDDAGAGIDASSGADAMAQTDTGSSGALDIPGWTLVFDDEFNGSLLDPSKNWQVYSGPQGNAPTFSHFSPEETYVENGLLRLRIEHKTVGGDPYACGGLEVPSANAKTYGRWVVRARFPAGKGNVGYMGLFGATSTEIDFGEVAGKTPLVNSFTQHYAPNDQQDQHSWAGTDSTAAFHEYTVIWEPGKLTWLVDGVQQYQTNQYFADESLVVAIGDWAAPCSIAWAGCPDATTVYPAYMDVDYVRIYTKN